MKFNLTRRWVRSRPGSVLILVIALLVLLALIGTAYLSSTQTERYTSVQNSINTEADLLIDGLQIAANSQIVGGLYGTSATGTAYRPPQGEMPTYSTGTAVLPTLSTYHNYDSTYINENPPLPAALDQNPPDLFLASRMPSYPAAPGAPVWDTISWPLFSSSATYSFDSPFGASFDLGDAVQKGNILCVPASTTVNGALNPAMYFYVPSGKTFTSSTGTTTVGPNYVSATATIAADADGDGIADAGLFKLPVGTLDGVTYYGAVRVVDGNSAINASTADATNLGLEQNVAPTMPSTVYGFFRSDIGLKNLLSTATNSTYSTQDSTTALNGYRFPTYNSNPIADSGSTAWPTNFTWYCWGDQIENQITRRPGNPGNGGGNWLGPATTAALAYKYSLLNPSSGANYSTVEGDLPNSLLTAQSSPWSASQVSSWWTANFQYLGSYNGTNSGSPLRTLLVGNNAVSNATPARLGNASSASAPVWVAGHQYNFGDWVVDGPTGGPYRSFVCIQAHSSITGVGVVNGPIATNPNQPNPGPYTSPTATSYASANPGALGVWAGAQNSISAASNAVLPGVPWHSQPVKTSVNTGTFEQLWLAFAQVMTDSVSINPIPSGDSLLTTSSGSPGTLVAQWQPPMLPVTVATTNKEQQMGMFRSVIRDSLADGAGKHVLTSAQMLKLRAAIAAVNTIDLRDSDDDVSSRDIVLTDDSGKPQFDVEVYGIEKEPYISEVVIQTDGSPYAPGNNNSYVAIEICNPYPTAITLNNWQIGYLDRSTFPNMNLSAGIAIPTGTIVPAAKNGVPGLLILEDGTEPGDVTTTITNNKTSYPIPEALDGQAPVAVAGLFTAVVNQATSKTNEVFIMRPRLASGTLSKSSGNTSDTYDENSATTDLADYVPVDQMDFTGLPVPATNSGSKAVRFLYRRANDASNTPTYNQGWHCVYPGAYDPTQTTSRYLNVIGLGGTPAIITDPTALLSCGLGGPTIESSSAAVGQISTYSTLPIELNNANMAGPNPNKVGGGTAVFPFGAFARNMDLLKVTFIGSYRIRDINLQGKVSQSLIELNSVTTDSALAYDNTPTPYSLTTAVSPNADNSNITTALNEQIGRFCPIGDPTATTADLQMDFGPGYTATSTPANSKVYWHYHWAKKLFDYLTVQAPSDDYFPNVDPANYGALTAAPGPVANTNGQNANAQTPGYAEDTTGIEGLININTAPAAVLAQLPFYGGSTLSATAQATANATMAQTIVAYRNTNGPFQSIYDLYNVPAAASVAGSQSFEDANNSLLPTGAAAGPSQGVFSPSGIGTAAIAVAGATRFDFQDRFVMLNNISNLITTRSDTFTVYLLLQGWRNVGTGNPTLVVQRRRAYLVDRNGVTPSNNQVSTFPVASE
jgi:hypothetical protein